MAFSLVGAPSLWKRSVAEFLQALPNKSVMNIVFFQSFCWYRNVLAHFIVKMSYIMINWPFLPFVSLPHSSIIIQWRRNSTWAPPLLFTTKLLSSVPSHSHHSHSYYCQLGCTMMINTHCSSQTMNLNEWKTKCSEFWSWKAQMRTSNQSYGLEKCLIWKRKCCYS